MYKLQVCSFIINEVQKKLFCNITGKKYENSENVFKNGVPNYNETKI